MKKDLDPALTACMRCVRPREEAVIRSQQVLVAVRTFLCCDNTANPQTRAACAEALLLRPDASGKCRVDTALEQRRLGAVTPGPCQVDYREDVEVGCRL